MKVVAANLHLSRESRTALDQTWDLFGVAHCQALAIAEQLDEDD